MPLQKAHKVRPNTAGKQDSAVVDFFPGIVSGNDGRFNDHDAVVTAASETADPDFEVSVGFNEGGSYFCGFQGVLRYN